MLWLNLTCVSLILCNSEEATAVMVELLRTYSDENASEVKDDATNCIISLLGRPNVLIMDFLLTLPPVAALQGEPIYQVHKIVCVIVQTNENKDMAFPQDIFRFLGLPFNNINCLNIFLPLAS